MGQAAVQPGAPEALVPSDHRAHHVAAEASCLGHAACPQAGTVASASVAAPARPHLSFPASFLSKREILCWVRSRSNEGEKPVVLRGVRHRQKWRQSRHLHEDKVTDAVAREDEGSVNPRPPRIETGGGKGVDI